ncbi:MAG: 2-keto-4-pentenoate hydratase [Vicinamibacterales bacterium]
MPAIKEAAGILWRHWRGSTRIDQLPAHCRPRDRAEGYAIQAEVARLSGQRVVGWKIAATSVVGQRHIRVDGPLAGRLLSDRVVDHGTAMSLDGNAMKVAEAEFAFRMATSLPRRSAPYMLNEVLAAVDSLHPAIEIPDSRYDNCALVGAPQLIADTACACWATIGPPARMDWRAGDLAAHRVLASRNGVSAGEGRGANVLGDPRQALTWLANELTTYANGLGAGDVVMTGTCIAPVDVSVGDRVRMDFGDLGALEAAF